MAKKRSHKLEFVPEFDFRLLGLSSDENDYRLIWNLNTELGWNLGREENISFHVPDMESEQEFSYYTYRDEMSHLYYQFVSNRSDRGFLLEELRNIDYLLKISGELRNGELSRMQEKIRNLPTVRAVFEIPPASLKARNRLIF